MNVISKEEEQFNKTIDQGLGILAEMISDMEEKRRKDIDFFEVKFLTNYVIIHRNNVKTKYVV